MPPTLLCILDGLGLNPRPEGNAVQLANTPCLDTLLDAQPNTTLITYGERVGLPDGQMGNSEVGHLNIGAGRVVEQWLLRIGRSLKSGAFLGDPSFIDFAAVTQRAPATHLVGLFSAGGVHSHYEHALTLLHAVRQQTDRPIYLHIITDGRDSSPTAAASLLTNTLPQLPPNCFIASLCGRFFAMDRDNRWERVNRAYQAIVTATAPPILDPASHLEQLYTQGIMDEFVEPVIVTPRPIQPDDAVLFWNFREDRMRELVTAICAPSFEYFARPLDPPPSANVLCCTDYDPRLGLPHLFQSLDLSNHLGEYLSGAGLTQLRIAETEKYAHVTYFFNGGIETPYPGEDRILVPSPRDVATYDLKPEMSALEVADQVCRAIHSGRYNLIVVNFANCDMVGHTGVLSAAIRAVETVDTMLIRVIEALNAEGGNGLIIADHGNAEQMVDYVTGSPHTMHTTHPVPCILLGSPPKTELRPDGALCDVAPTILELLNLPVPPEMTGQSLIVR